MTTADSSELKVAVVTGAAGGLGRALVEAFENGGWMVAAGEHRNRIHSQTEKIQPVSLDVTDPESIRAAVESVMDRWGRIDAWINNAGATADSPILKLGDDEWDRAMDVNLKGAFLCARTVWRILMRQRSGHLINVTSFAAKNGHPGQAAYVAAKAGMIGLTQSLAREAGTRNVRVNAILPGVLETAMTAGLSAGQKERLAGSNVLGRSTTVEEVASFIVHLAAMQNVSGQLFQLDSRIGRWT